MAAETATNQVSTEFEITPDMVNAFARLTGDYNSMHMDTEVARKSRYRRTIVHGMLPFSFISLVQTCFPDQAVCFRTLATRFNRPIFTGDIVALELTFSRNDDNSYAIKGKWYRKGEDEPLLSTKGTFDLVTEATHTEQKDGDTRDCFLLEPVTENQYTIDDMEAQEEVLHVEMSNALIRQYGRDILSHASPENIPPDVCPDLITTLLLSTMVGMRLPGRYATFTRFNIAFENRIPLHQACTLRAALVKVSRAAEQIEAEFTVECGGQPAATGKFGVMLAPPPRTMPTCVEIQQQHMDFGLSGKVALITGASRGIGETAAKLLSMLGTKTIITYFHGKSDAERIVDDIRAAGGDAFAAQCDVRDDEQISNLLAEVIERYGRIDILVNNAVKEFTPKDVTELDWEDYLGEMEVSVKGLHACCSTVIPIFKKAGGGKIINMSTVAVTHPVARQSCYITAKSAVEGYTRSLAVEVAKHNIQVNLVVPNMTETDLVSVIPALFREKIAEARPYKRHVYPIEVAQCIAYLASDWSNAMTGQKVVLNLGEPPFA